MKRKIFILIGLISIFLFTGCSTITLHNINRIDSKEEYKNILTDVAFLTTNGDAKITYNRYQPIDQCLKDFKGFIQLLGDNNTLHEELLAREIKLNYINQNDKPKKLLVLTPGMFYSCIQGNPLKLGQTVEIHLYDIESISNDWDKIDIHKKLKQISNLPNDLIIYRKEYFVFSADYKKNIARLSSDIALDLEELHLLPPKVKTIEDIKKQLEEKRKNNHNLVSEKVF